MKQRKLTAVVLSLAMMIVHGTTTFEAEEVEKFDVDGNGIIQMADVVLLNHLIVEDVGYCAENTITVYDLNDDGCITVEDVTMLMEYMRENNLLSDTTTTTELTTTSTTTTETTTTTTSTQTTTTSTTPTQTTTTETTTGTTSTTTTSTTTTIETTTSTTTTSTSTTTTTTDTTTPSTITDTTSVSKWVNPTRDEVIDKFTSKPIEEWQYEECLELISQYNVEYWDIRSINTTPITELYGTVCSDFWEVDVDFGCWWFIYDGELEYLQTELYPYIEEEDINFHWSPTSQVHYLMQPYRNVDYFYLSIDGKWIMQPETRTNATLKYELQIVLLDEYGNELKDQNIFNYAKIS